MILKVKTLADVPSSEITPEHVYRSRREFMRTAAAGAAGVVAGQLLGAGDGRLVAAPQDLPAAKKSAFTVDAKVDPLNTFEQMGPYTYANAVATMKFRDENPKLFAAVAAALREAQDSIEKDRKAAVREWMAATKSALPYEMVARMLDEPGTNWGATPQGVQKIGRFMVDVGLVKTAPATWDAIYFPETVKGLKGD